MLNRWAWAAAVWVCVIFFSSTSLALKWAEAVFGFLSGALFGSLKTSPGSFDLVHLLADKGFHVALFCVLAVLLWLAFAGNLRKAWLILVCGAIVGSCSEFLQRFFPDRDPALRDVLINTCGTAFGLMLCFALTRIRRGTPSSV